MPSVPSSVGEKDAWAVFVAFSRITLSSWGGPVFWARRELVEHRGWLTEKEFLELFTIGQLLPGGNILNVAVLIGRRFAGWKGVAAGVTGFMFWPFLIVTALGYFYERYGDLPMVRQAFVGMSAVAAGLVIASGIRVSNALPKHWRPWLWTVLSFIGVGIMRWPFFWVIGALAPLAIMTNWKETH